MNERKFIIEKQLDGIEMGQYCTLAPQDTDGAEITPSDAFDAIRKFDHSSPNDPIQAFHLGLKEFNRLYLEITSYNQSPDEEKGMIIGIRFYRAITSRTFEGNEIDDAYDLIIVPTYESDMNDHNFSEEIQFDSETVPMISYLRPCPKLCGTVSLI